MSEFWVVTSIGHCATKWLARVLDAQPDITATHELKMSVSGLSWTVAAKYEQRYGPDSAKYRPYFEHLDSAGTPVVADVNSWAPWRLPAVHEKRPIDRLIYVVRHGVSQLHSLSRKSAAWKNGDPDDYIYSGYLQEMWELVAHPNPDPETTWQALCWLWAIASYDVPYRLSEMGLPVEVVTFEELTQSAAGLQKVLPGLSHGQALRWRKKDVNRKVEGERRPAALWRHWSEQERTDFRRICAGSMAAYDYDIPEVA